MYNVMNYNTVILSAAKDLKNNLRGDSSLRSE